MEDLRAALKLKQRGLARRAGVKPPQISNWIRGVQKPSQSRLEAWAEREGWPIEVFAEGGPMPSAVLASLLTPRVGQVRENGATYATNGQEGARASDSATARVIPAQSVDEVRAAFAARLAECRRAGKDLPLAEAFVWVDAALRAKRSASGEG